MVDTVGISAHFLDENLRDKCHLKSIQQIEKSDLQIFIISNQIIYQRQSIVLELCIQLKKFALTLSIHVTNVLYSTEFA